MMGQPRPVAALTGIVDALNCLAGALVQPAYPPLAGSTQKSLAQGLLGKAKAILAGLERQLVNETGRQEPVNDIEQLILIQLGHHLE